jgi:dCMP deaminase
MNKENTSQTFQFKGWPRPSWDTYFMTLAFITAMRSPDESAKHGAIIIDNEKTKILVSQGYNGYPRGVDHKIVPKTRPEKYYWTIHAEANAILNAGRNGVHLENSILYVTGHPCIECTKKIIQSGIKKVIYGPINSTHSVTKEDRKLINKMISRSGVVFQEYKGDGWKKLAKEVLKYADIKLNEKKNQF